MQRLGIYFSNEDIEYIDKIKKEYHCSSRNKAISLIINEHKNKQNDVIKNVPEYIAKIIAEELKDEFRSMKKLKSATSSIDKEMQILLELINGIYYREDYGVVPPLDSFPTEAYQKVVERVENKIAREQYIKNKSLD